MCATNRTMSPAKFSSARQAQMGRACWKKFRANASRCSVAGQSNQMDLQLNSPQPGKLAATALPQTQDGAFVPSESEFWAFAKVGEKIAATAAKLEKISLLSDYLRTLDHKRLSLAATYFTGRAFPQSYLRTLQVGGSIIYRAIMAAAELNGAEFRRI